MFVTLLYHSINRRNIAKTAISEEAFEAQMGFLHKEGYSILTLAQAINFISGKQVDPQRAVLLTFDDGFADNVLAVIRTEHIIKLCRTWLVNTMNSLFPLTEVAGILALIDLR